MGEFEVSLKSHVTLVRLEEHPEDNISLDPDDDLENVFTKYFH